MDHLLENLAWRDSDLGQHMLATYKDWLNYFRRSEELAPIVSEDAEVRATEQQVWIKTPETLDKGGNQGG
ncbi:MAG: hypothetical protein AB1817_04380 [Chloroflexota bacterium]